MKVISILGVFVVLGLCNAQLSYLSNLANIGDLANIGKPTDLGNGGDLLSISSQAISWLCPLGNRSCPLKTVIPCLAYMLIRPIIDILPPLVKDVAINLTKNFIPIGPPNTAPVSILYFHIIKYFKFLFRTVTFLSSTSVKIVSIIHNSGPKWKDKEWI